MKNKEKPNPIYKYDGVGIYQNSKIESIIKVGSEEVKNDFSISNAITSSVENVSTGEDLAEFTVKFAQEENETDSPDLSFQTDFQQNGEKWEMIFSIISDKNGGLIGGDFALDIVDCNFPDIKMSIPRTNINQANFGVLKRAILPENYKATLVTKFWNNGELFGPDGWIELEVAYVQDPDKVDGSIPKVAIGKTKMHPGLNE